MEKSPFEARMVMPGDEYPSGNSFTGTDTNHSVTLCAELDGVWI
jgi:hypothetical protein